jgi:CRISPR-associated protein Cas1
MKKLGNVLYVLTPQSYLYCQNETIAIKVGGEETKRLPAHLIESIVCIGNTTVSSPFIGFCGDRNISLSFVSDYGEFYGRIYGGVSGNVLLRKKQYEYISNAEKSESIIKNILYAKLINSRYMIKRYMRNSVSDEAKARLNRAADKITSIADLIEQSEGADSIRGLEGAAASIYFSVFDDMLSAKDKEMCFEKRSKRPPENRFNALLSFLYMILKNDVETGLECVGLDPAAGYMHTIRPGRASLALDLMEELRAPLCDRMAISLVHLGQISKDDFLIDAEGIKLKDKSRKKVITQWQERKKETIIHPFLKEKIQIGLIPYVQSQMLARYIRGDLDVYPPFVWR